MDGSDSAKFLADANRASLENLLEARAFEKRISEQYIKPTMRRLSNWLWNSGKRLCSSSHRRRWDHDNHYD
jgi:hypothetical protein